MNSQKGWRAGALADLGGNVVTQGKSGKFVDVGWRVA
jgi:hypothetical protein